MPTDELAESFPPAIHPAWNLRVPARMNTLRGLSAAVASVCFATAVDFAAGGASTWGTVPGDVALNAVDLAVQLEQLSFLVNVQPTGPLNRAG